MNRARVKRITTQLGLLGLILCFTAPLAMARQGQGPMHEGGPGFVHFGPPIERLVNQLDLSEQQQEEIKRLRNQSRRKAIPIMAEIQTVHLDLRDTIESDSANMKDVDAYVAKLSDLQAKLLKQRITTEIAVRQVLTKKQRHQLDLLQTKQGGKDRPRMCNRERNRPQF